MESPEESNKSSLLKKQNSSDSVVDCKNCDNSANENSNTAKPSNSNDHNDNNESINAAAADRPISPHMALSLRIAIYPRLAMILQALRKGFASKALCEISSASQFKSHLAANPRTLVDFHAVWCGPCKMMTPVLEKAAQVQNDISIVKVDIDQVPELAQHYEVTAVPTVIAFDKGQPVNRFMGAKDERFLGSFIKESFE